MGAKVPETQLLASRERSFTSGFREFLVEGLEDLPALCAKKCEDKYSRSPHYVDRPVLDQGFDAWGPIVEDDTRLRSERAVMLVAERMQMPVEEIADELLEQPLRHRYLLVEYLAQTRRATVFAAVDLLLAQEVALKIHHDDDEEVIHRSLAEARAMASVDHPNVVRILDVGVHEGWAYTVIELCESDLERWCMEKSWLDVVDRILEAGEGLQALHDAGIIHADIKPANILIKGGVAKLADLGLAGAPGLVARISGTPGFIAPEVADGHRGEPGDLFALACTAWYCLFGAVPFGDRIERASASAATFVLVERARAGEINAPTELPAGMPLRLVEVLRAGLGSDPSQRPSLRGWAGELRTLRGRPPIGARLARCAGRLAFACGLALLGAAGNTACSRCHVPAESSSSSSGTHSERAPTRLTRRSRP